MYKVSLAIPIYNVSLFVERALLSVLNQTYDNIEYLIVDDKGQDDSMDIVHRIIKDHPRGKDVRIIEHPYNIGLGATRNTTIDNAQGEYLFFMDSDDEIIPTCIEILVHKMQEHPVDFIAASHMKKDLSGKTYPTYTYSPILIQGDDLPVAQYRYAQNNDIYVMSWNKLYNLNFLKSHNIQCIPHQLVEDCWFTYQVIISAKSCQLISDQTLYYTINPESTTSKIKTQGYSMKLSISYAEIEKTKRAYIAHLRAHSIYPCLLFDTMFMGLYHAYRILCVDNKMEKQERKKLACSLLTRNFQLPNRIICSTSYLRFLAIYIFYSLPITIKINLVNLAIKFKIKDILQKWFHFN